MAVWIVRAGKKGERQDFALDNGCVVIGWNEVLDATGFADREELKAFIKEQHPNYTPAKIATSAGQVWNFVHGIKEGDYVALPLKGQSAVAFGKVTGPYQYKPDNPSGAKHVRAVEWISHDTPRGDFSRDILNSLGSLLTVAQVRADNAQERMLAVVQGKPEPPSTIQQAEGVGGETEVPTPADLETIATDELRTYISRKFAGHELATLVEAILTGQGYQTQVSTPGPDGGVDIVAGQGAMGFDPPRLCVQVKGGKGKQDVKVLRELKGVMKDFGADQGLFVSWGGFTREAKKEARRVYFEIRLWDADDLLAAMLRNYEHFPEDLKAELPLKRIWTLVPEEQEE